MERTKARARLSFTPEFKAEIVERCQRGDDNIGQVATDLDLIETNVRHAVKQVEIDHGERPGLTKALCEERWREIWPKTNGDFSHLPPTSRLPSNSRWDRHQPPAPDAVMIILVTPVPLHRQLKPASRC